jgi:hypothetical protein
MGHWGASSAYQQPCTGRADTASWSRIDVACWVPCIQVVFVAVGQYAQGADVFGSVDRREEEDVRLVGGRRCCRRAGDLPLGWMCLDGKGRNPTTAGRESSASRPSVQPSARKGQDQMASTPTTSVNILNMLRCEAPGLALPRQSPRTCSLAQSSAGRFYCRRDRISYKDVRALVHVVLRGVA